MRPQLRKVGGGGKELKEFSEAESLGLAEWLAEEEPRLALGPLPVVTWRQGVPNTVGPAVGKGQQTTC